MAVVREVLDVLGVLDRETQPPEMPPLEASFFEAAREGRALRKEELEAQHCEARGVRSTNPGQVPAFKFETNVGWHVTAGECAVLAEALWSCDALTLTQAIARASEDPTLRLVAGLYPGALQFPGEDRATEMLQAFADYCARCIAWQGFFVS